MRWSAVIPGKPSGKKNRMKIITLRGRPLIVQNAEVKAYCQGAAKAVALQWRKPPITGPVSLSCTVYQHPRQRGDLSNYLAAVCDILQDGLVVVNDKQITRLVACELTVDRDNPRVELALEWSGGDALPPC